MKRRAAQPMSVEPTVVELVRQLGGVLGELGLAELEIAIGETRIRLARHASGGAVAERAGAAVAPVETGESTLAPPLGAITVEAPMVGTFYRAASPSAEPYVCEGAVVKEGQILCIIEAMKLMNEIEAKVPGRVVRILVENAQPVEYGQPLFLIDPAR